MTRSNIQHKDLAAGRWNEMSVSEQMANIGSEVFRGMKWRNKGKTDVSNRCIFRALELLDLSLSSPKLKGRFKEFARLREALVDYFLGDNEFKSTDILWEKYFNHFNYAARM